ncbi:hypothetical protein [Thalassobacter stenotrophicus]|uniref:Uncharacterized protein n=2 Tax=Thalassobacter stenotrophicus TaxID=266809 RepID=A0A0P1F204_9RHOB|nr:hypothetical protein [Thalassobacter stenotrophicus]CUH61623.1 hypothetical protein THS5294_02934 [Thalassobacter stenotrophicus]SHJ36256.1 hypothetical protein SAMN02744035_03507 [Thalassobacter stenotrophicus DSM 16310]
MGDTNRRLTAAETKGLRTAKELEGHLAWLDTFTPAALGVLAIASGVYTYLGVTSLLEDTGAMSFFAAVAYSVAVSVGIFVFWSYMLRLLPSMRTAGGFIGLTVSTMVGSLAIIAMSSWLNAAALAGSAAVEQHLERTVRGYQSALEQAHDIALSAQALEREVRRAREAFEALAEQERSGELSGTAGEGAVYRVLRQKTEELQSLEEQISEQQPLIVDAYEQGNEILGRMRGLTVAPGPVEQRSVAFSEESVRLAGVISNLNQFSVALLVARAAEDLPASVVLPELDGQTTSVRQAQSSTIGSVLDALDQRSQTLGQAAGEVLAMEPPQETAYNPISSADAVIRYAGNFVPSWAGAIAIDLLPGVLVFVLAVTQAAIRNGRDGLSIEETLTLADLRAAVSAMREVEMSMNDMDTEILRRVRGSEAAQDDNASKAD